MPRGVLIFLLLVFLTSCLRTEEDSPAQHTPFLNVDSASADSILMRMTLEEKIGQLIILKTDMKNEFVQRSVYQWVRSGMLGGVLLEDMEIEPYVRLVDTLRYLSKIPLLNGTQQSVVLNNQFSDAVNFPLAPSIGAIQNDTIQRQLELLFVQQCKNLGINFCMSPSANRVQSTDKKYPTQVFENSAKQQTERAKRVLKNLQKENILSIGNSFDDFYQLENDTIGLLNALLARQKSLAQNGVSGFVIDEHIFEIDSIKQLQTFFLKNYLREKLGFDGLLIAEISPNATLDKLIHSGVDMFVVQDSAQFVFDYLYGFVKEGLLSEKVLNAKVHKILLAKKYAGLDQQPNVLNLEKAKEVLQNEHFKYNARQLFEHSITLAHNYNNVLPYTKTYRRDFRIINVGQEKLEVFKDYFSKYANYKNYNHPSDELGKLKPLKTILYKKSATIIVLDQVNLDTVQHRDFINSINDLSKEAKVALVNFGNPLNLQYLDTTMALVQVFEKNDVTESLVPQLLFGGITAQGKLPLSVTPHLVYGKSVRTPVTRLKYAEPQEVGISPEKLVGINAIIQSAIRKKATPGAQVMVIKNGKVIFDESFGHHTYDKKQKIRNSDLYDLASMTKVAATSLAAMKVFEAKKFKLSDRLEKKMDFSKKSKLGRITFKQLMTHSSGLQANMPISRIYWKRDTLASLCNEYFCETSDSNYTVQLGNDVFLHQRWVDTLWKKIDELKVKRRGRYKYSDVNFNLLQRYLEKETRQPLDKYLDQEFYKPLDLRRTAFRPLQKFSAKHIAPTEQDDRWRGQLLRGYVHDESASMLGGVAGNSGLFSNATDMGVLFQMLLNGGEYGGQKYLKPATIKKFTSANYGNHRGLGFVVKGRRGANSLSSEASGKTFGHTGFTGTCVWVDPKSELIYIFLSNRIHPSKANTKLYRNQVRRRIHDVIYKALDTYEVGKKGEERMLVDL